MLELYLKLNCTFTDAEKEACIPTIKRIVELAQKVRMEGLLSLGDELKTEQNFFLKTGIGLAVDSFHPDYIKDFLQAIILSDNRKGSELLERMIIINGICCIVNGDNPRMIALQLAGMLGEEYLKKGAEYYR